MGTAITPRLVDVIDTVSAEHGTSAGVTRRLTFCQVESWGLRMECPLPEDPFADGEVAWLIPEAGVRLTYRRPRSRHARYAPATLTACRIERGARSWRTTDLLLGLCLPGGTTTRIVGSEEFAAAVAGRILHPADADLALHTVHRTFEELTLCYHDLQPWLTHHRITTPWPPL